MNAKYVKCWRFELKGFSMLGGRLSIVLLALALLALAISGAPSVAQEEYHSGSMPEQGSLWVSESRAKAADGSLSLQSFRESDRQAVVDQLNSARERRQGASSDDVTCTTFATRSDPAWDYRPVDTLEQMTANARIIVTGRVAKIERGFLAGFASALLYLSQSSVLKEDAGFDLSRPAVVYPEAKIVIEDVAFCARDPLFPQRPAVGDRLLIFQQLPARDLEGNLVEPFAHGLFIEFRDGEMFTPPQLRHEVESYTSLDEIIGQVNSLLEERQEEERAE